MNLKLEDGLAFAVEVPVALDERPPQAGLPDVEGLVLLLGGHGGVLLEAEVLAVDLVRDELDPDALAVAGVGLLGLDRRGPCWWRT